MLLFSPSRVASVPVLTLIVFLLGIPQPKLSAQGVTLSQTGPINLGSANVCPAGQTTPAPCSNSATLTYNVAAGTTIGTVNILTTGIPNLDFHVKAGDTSTTLCAAIHYAAATTCTVDVTFAPLAPGQRKGAVQVLDGSGAVLANTYLYGTGGGPAIAFAPTPATPLTLGSGFSSPSGIVVDAGGNLFIADTGNNVVKEILAAGGYTTIKTVATGFNGPNGIAIDGSGNLFVADTKNGDIKEILAVGGTIPATPTIRVLSSGFIEPISVAVDTSGNVFVNDVTNNGSSEVAGKVHPEDVAPSASVIKELIAVNGSIPTDPTITTILNFSSSLNFLKLDSNNNLYTGYYYYGDVFELTAASGYQTIRDITGEFFDPIAVTVDAAGDVYVSDQDSSSVYEVLAVNGSIPANPTIVLLANENPSDLAIDGSGNLFLANYYGTAGITELPNAQPPTLAFHTTAPGTTSPDSPKSIQIQNVGNATLTGSGSLSDSTDFTVVPGAHVIPDCDPTTLSLATGAACNLSFDFTPQSAGPLTSTLTLTDNSFNGNPATQQITLTTTTQAIATSTYLSSSAPSETTAYGQPITFTATVTAATGPTPMGDVIFSIGGTPAATVALVNGTATYTTSTIPMTTGIAIVANYQGNSLDAPSTSNSVTQVVQGYTTHTTLTSSANPAVYGQPIAFTATVTATGGSTPTGTVYFDILGGPSGYPEIAVPLVNGVATYVTSSFPVTTSGIEVGAGYAGNDGQSSSSLTQVVTAPAGSVNFSNGFNGSGSVLKTNGGASVFNNFLQLTPDTKNQAGSAFFKTRQNIQAFTTDFLIFTPGSDGFTFTIQSNSDGALGGIGGGLGYYHIPNSVAIKFDTFNNVGEGSNSIGLFTDGAFPGLPALDLTAAGISLANDFEIPAHITYDGANLILTLTNPATGKYWSHTWAIDIPAVVGSPTAYVGFTSSTGDLLLDAGIYSWTFNSGKPAPNYPTFNATGLTLNGSSAVSDAKLVLTDGGKQETSSAFYTLPQNVEAFITDFDLETANASADGFTFTIQNNAPATLGGNGGGLGYKGIPNSVAIKFDLYSNEGEGPNSTGLYTGGAFPGIDGSIDLTGTGIDLHGPDRIKAHLTYNGVILTLTLTDAVTGAAWTHTWPIDIPTTVGGTSAYIGFTAASGGLTATQTISRWTYIPGTSALQSEP